jgi:hypothetical protein
MTMKLLFLHGAPAVGKLTVAKALLKAIPGRLFDNHAAIDVARTVFDFGAPGFWELVLDVQCAVLEAAAGQNTPMVVMTYCYADPEDLPTFRQFEAIAQQSGGQLLPVFLHCVREEAIRRIGNPDRAERRKITSAEGLAKFLDEFNLTQVPRPDCLVLDTGMRSPDATAQEIIQHFGLR